MMTTVLSLVIVAVVMAQAVNVNKKIQMGK